MVIQRSMVLGVTITKVIFKWTWEEHTLPSECDSWGSGTRFPQNPSGGAILYSYQTKKPCFHTSTSLNPTSDLTPPRFSKYHHNHKMSGRMAFSITHLMVSFTFILRKVFISWNYLPQVWIHLSSESVSVKMNLPHSLRFVSGWISSDII